MINNDSWGIEDSNPVDDIIRAKEMLKKNVGYIGESSLLEKKIKEMNKLINRYLKKRR